MIDFPSFERTGSAVFCGQPLPPYTTPLMETLSTGGAAALVRSVGLATAMLARERIERNFIVDRLGVVKNRSLEGYGSLWKLSSPEQLPVDCGDILTSLYALHLSSPP